MAVESESAAPKPATAAARWVAVGVIFALAGALVFLDHRAEQTAFVLGTIMVVAFVGLIALECGGFLLRKRTLDQWLTFAWWHNVGFGLGFPLWHYAIAVRAYGPMMSVDIVREIMGVYLLLWLVAVVVATGYRFAGTTWPRFFRAAGFVAIVAVGVAVTLGLFAAFVALLGLDAWAAFGAGAGWIAVVGVGLRFFEKSTGRLGRLYQWAFPHGPTLMDWYVMLMKLIGHLTLATVFFLGGYRPYLPTEWRLTALRQTAELSVGAFLGIAVAAIFLILYLFLKRHFTTVVALRFVVRRRLSYMAMVTVALGVFVLLLVTAIMGGFKDELRSRVRGSLSHVFLYVSTPNVNELRFRYDLPGTTDDALGQVDYPMLGEVLQIREPRPEFGGAESNWRWLFAELRRLGVTVDDVPSNRGELVRRGVVAHFDLPAETDYDTAMRVALTRHYGLPASVVETLTLPETVMMARAKRVGCPDFREATTPEGLMSALRRHHMREQVAERKASVMKLNDPAYRMALIDAIDRELQADRADPVRQPMHAGSREALRRARAALIAIDPEETQVIDGASGRVRTMALIVRKHQRELDYCQLYGIDPIFDLTISEMGVYLEQALYKEMHERLIGALDHARMMAVILFPDPAMEGRPSAFNVPLDDVNPHYLTETGRQLFEQLRITSSLISKVPPRDPGPSLPLREEDLLRECRVKLRAILDNQAQIASADEAQKIEEFRALMISGTIPLVDFLQELHDGERDGFADDDPAAVAMRETGMAQRWISPRSPVPLPMLPNRGEWAVMPRIEAALQAAKTTVETASTYAERLNAAVGAGREVEAIFLRFFREQWPALRDALASGAVTANDIFAELQSLPMVRLSGPDLSAWEQRLRVTAIWLANRATPEPTFWSSVSVYSALDRLIEVDLAIVRAHLLDQVVGTGPVNGVKFAYRRSGIEVARKIPAELGDAGAQLHVGDRIHAINRQPVPDFAAFRDVVAAIEVGAPMTVEWVRDGAPMTMTVAKESEFRPGVHQIIPFERFSDFRPPARVVGSSGAPQTRPQHDVPGGVGPPRDEWDDGQPMAAPEADFPPMLIGDRLSEAYSAMQLRPSYTSRLHLATAVAVEPGGGAAEEFQAREQGFHVAGLFHSRLYEDDRRRVYITFDDALRFIDGSQTKILVGVKLAGQRYEQTQSYKLAIAAAVAHDTPNVGLDRVRMVLQNAATWEEERANLLAAVDREEMLLTLVLSMIILYAGIMIIIIIYLMVKEKTKDIGILKALGGSPDGIQSIFLFNGLFIGVFGALLGLLGGLVMVLRSNWIEDTIERIFGFRIFPPDVYYLTYIPMKADPWTWVMICVPTILLSFLFALYPANQAAKLDPVQALQYE